MITYFPHDGTHRKKHKSETKFFRHNRRSKHFGWCRGIDKPTTAGQDADDTGSAKDADGIGV